MVFDEQLRSGAITEPRAEESGIKTQRAKEMSLESFSNCADGGSCILISLATAHCSVTGRIPTPLTQLYWQRARVLLT